MNLHLWNFHKNLILKQKRIKRENYSKENTYTSILHWVFGLNNMKLKVLLNPIAFTPRPCPPLINYEKSKVSFCKTIKTNSWKEKFKELNNIKSDEQLLLKKRRWKTNEFLCNYFACMCSISTESWLLLCVCNKQHLL